MSNFYVFPSMQHNIALKFSVNDSFRCYLFKYYKLQAIFYTFKNF